MKTHRVADVIAGFDEYTGLSTVNHDNSKGFAESGATPETNAAGNVCRARLTCVKNEVAILLSG